MSADLAAQLISHMLWTAVLVAAPVLGIALVVGVLVSILQVVTQVQEMSLTFVPKLGAVVLVLVVLGPWMIKRIAAFASGLITSIPKHF